jgi:formylglycine-generating enzyme required for sulfatase activity
MAQTGRKEPAFFHGRSDIPVTGVTYDDAYAFNKWQGRSLPTEELLGALGGQYPTFGRKISAWQAKYNETWFLEWTSTPTKKEGSAVVYTLSHSVSRYSNPFDRMSNVGFRVGGSAIKNDGDEARGYMIWEGR